jgi:hypothetical protein
MKTPPIPLMYEIAETKGNPKISYRWVEGTNINNYMTAAQ